jgi:hypothetical protein
MSLQEVRRTPALAPDGRSGAGAGALSAGLRGCQAMERAQAQGRARGRWRYLLFLDNHLRHLSRKDGHTTGEAIGLERARNDAGVRRAAALARLHLHILR